MRNFIMVTLCLLYCNQTLATEAIDQQGPVPILLETENDIDCIDYLMASSAKRPKTTTVFKFPEPKHGWLESISNDEPIEWKLYSERENVYLVTTFINTLSADQKFKLEIINGDSLEYVIDNKGWQKHHSGKIKIPSGLSLLRLTRLSNSNDIQLKSIELLNLNYKSAYDTRVKNFKSDTFTFSKYPYGLMFQYGGWGYPQTGDAKSLDDQANYFDVDKFVEMIKGTGAQYVIWSATWWTYEINAPIAEVDILLNHSNRTSSRDLIGDIATALNEEGIGFFLYYHTGQDSHLGYNTTDWWQLNQWPSSFTATGTGDRRLFFSNWKRVIGAIGERYGEMLDGWFFDDGLVYYPAPFEELAIAAKEGNAIRLISYNSWKIGHYTDFEDLSFGEVCKAEGAPVGGDGLYMSTGDKGLYGHCMYRMEDTWGIYMANQRIGSPQFTVESAFQTVMENSSRSVPTSFNLMMYEDGNVSQESLEVLRGLKRRLEEFGNTDGSW
ncbi:alpha-L-fucosidase [Vibrio mimicus]